MIDQVLQQSTIIRSIAEVQLHSRWQREEKGLQLIARCHDKTAEIKRLDLPIRADRRGIEPSEYKHGFVRS